MIQVADVTHLFKPDWDALLNEVQSIRLDRVELGDWGGWGVMTYTGSHREGFGTGRGVLNDDGTPSSVQPTSIDGRQYLKWSDAATPAVKKTITQVRHLGLFPSRARITTLEPNGKIKFHIDGENLFYRLHFVIKSNPKAFFETPDRAYHLEERHAYIFNTNYHHRVTNSGDEVRIHLMMDLNMTKQVQKLCEGHWIS